MSPLPTLGQKPWGQQLNDWLLIGHDASGNNLAAAADATKVDKDSVVVAATRIVASKLLAGDTQPAFRILGNGKIEWGAGGSTAPDVNLYRAAGALQTDSVVVVNGVLYANSATPAKYVLLGNNGSVNIAGISFGNLADANLYRSAAGVIKTDVEFRAVGEVHARSGSVAGQVIMGFAGPASEAGIKLGTALDTNLYRSAADSLKTDDSFVVGGPLLQANIVRTGAGANTIDIHSDGHIYMGSPSDTNLYRSAVNTLKTDGYIYAVGDLGARYGTATQVLMGYTGSGQAGLVFGSASDTNLYRAGAGSLKTDTDFTARSLNALETGAIGGIWSQRSGASLVAFGTWVGSDAFDRFEITADGTMKWGAGNVATDISLRRNATGELIADCDLVSLIAVSAGMGTAFETWMGSVGGKSGFYFGSAYDTTLYRSAAAQLSTNGGLIVNAATAGKNITLHTDGAIYFDPNDSVIYRSAAATLAISTHLQVASQMSAGGQVVSMAGNANQIALSSDGKLYFGNLADTNLYRALAGRLRTDGLLDVGKDISLDLANAGNRLYIGTDTSIYRTAASQLTMVANVRGVSDFTAQYGLAYQVRIGNSSSKAAIDFGSAYDASIYRQGPGDLRTGGSFITGTSLQAATEIIARSGSATQMTMGYIGGNAGLNFGSANDTNLYRTAANTLKTDGSLTLVGYVGANPAGVGAVSYGAAVAGELQNSWYMTNRGLMNWGPGGSSVADTNLYRLTVSALKTDGDFHAGFDVVSRPSGAAQTIIGGRGPAGQAGIQFGTPADTNLYRSAADTLQTDDQLRVPGNPSGAVPMGLLAGSALPFHIQGDTGSPYAAFLGHNCWYRASDAKFIWDGSHASFGSRAIQMDYTTGINFYADAAAATAGSAATPPLRFKIGNDGNITSYAGNLIVDANLGGYKILFGNGGDTNLYRLQAGRLQSDGGLSLQVPAGAGTVALGIRQTSDAGWRWYADPDGKMSWGFGSGSYDTNLYRANAAQLATDHQIHVRNGGTGRIILGSNSVTPTITFGNPNDTNLYRSAAAQLTSDGEFRSVMASAANSVGHRAIIPSTGVAYFPFMAIVTGDSDARWSVNQLGTLLFGPGNVQADVNLYRSNVGGVGPRLQTDNTIQAVGYQCRAGSTAAPTSGSKFIFDWVGSAYNAYIDNTFIVAIYSSDGRNKKSVKPLPSTWEMVKALNPVSFRWRDKDIFKDDGKTHNGFIAQEVEAIIPSGVSKDHADETGEQLMSLNLNSIVANLTKALQEAMTRIEALEAK
jgi:hypothetical protein